MWLYLCVFEEKGIFLKDKNDVVGINTDFVSNVHAVDYYKDEKGNNIEAYEFYMSNGCSYIIDREQYGRLVEAMGRKKCKSEA